MMLSNFFTKTVSSIFGSTLTKGDPIKPTKLEEYAILKSYQNIYERNKLKRPLSSLMKIEHSSAIPFGASPKTVSEQMTSIPKMALFNTQGVNRKILLFDEIVNNQAVQIEMHFHKNKLFFFKLMFHEASPNLRINMMKSLISTYQVKDVDLTLYSIFDNFNNCIQIRDLATFEVHFTAMDSPFFNTLVKAITKSDNQLIADYHLTSAPVINSI